MAKKAVKIIFAALLVILAFGIFLSFNNDIGIPKAMIENDARSSQKINDDWKVEEAISNTMAAFIFYPDNKADHTFSVYVNRSGLSFGYFFRGGGDITETEKYIAEFTVEGNNERAFISMNEQKVERLEIDDGNSVQIIEIDNNKPFAIILPVNAGNIVFYDVNGDIVETRKQAL